ncbi:hypothetical protein [Bacillus toyonensis]|uniref:hypothetical protein n=1 Tax=Bacillus toyonensis TaxID=155322 RepID=UPI002E24DCD1|nr:hypothetical protein [Bacillus toyonensis]
MKTTLSIEVEDYTDLQDVLVVLDENNIKLNNVEEIEEKIASWRNEKNFQEILKLHMEMLMVGGEEIYNLNPHSFTFEVAENALIDRFEMKSDQDSELVEEIQEFFRNLLTDIMTNFDSNENSGSFSYDYNQKDFISQVF